MAIGSVSPGSAPGMDGLIKGVGQAGGLPQMRSTRKEGEGETQGNASGTEKTQNGSGTGQTTSGMTREEKTEVQKLQSTDREVKAHEQAHIAAGGNLVRSGASFEYKRGPDGKLYAVGGEVSIDTSPVKDDPEATIQKANHIQRAALAPAKPSSQDHKVAAEATNMAMEARQELMREKYQQEGGTAAGMSPAADISV